MENKEYFKMQGQQVPIDEDKGVCIAHPHLVDQVKNLTKQMEKFEEKTTNALDKQSDQMDDLTKKIDSLEGYRLVEKAEEIGENKALKKVEQQQTQKDKIRDSRLYLLVICISLTSTFIAALSYLNSIKGG